MRKAILVLLAVVADVGSARDPVMRFNPAWLSDKAWEDGAAAVSVYRGRYKRYGVWRDAEARDYVVREYFDPVELTKRDTPDPRLIPVLKANRQFAFRTGTYDYRLMHSLFWDRRDGGLVKAVGTTQEGCGISFKRWDCSKRRLVYDTYWEGEGAGARDLRLGRGEFFFDELPFIGSTLTERAFLRIHPTLLTSNLRDVKTIDAVARREGRRCEVRGGDDSLLASFEYDEHGFLEAWTLPGAQEFKRVSFRRMYYWEHTGPGDERLLEGGK
ncbi:MAG: hypothetical protein ACREID_03125 [Planctomycetota bacterium]